MKNKETILKQIEFQFEKLNRKILEIELNKIENSRCIIAEVWADADNATKQALKSRIEQMNAQINHFI